VRVGKQVDRYIENITVYFLTPSSLRS